MHYRFLVKALTTLYSSHPLFTCDPSLENQNKLAQVIFEKIAKKDIFFVSFSITFHSFNV
jgi:hypothetical protein